MTFTGAARGIEISTQAAAFSLVVDSITFRGLSAGATAIHFLGGTFTSTIALANFEDTSVGANVSAAALDPASRITMPGYYGVRSDSAFENDPNSLVYWDAGPYPGCVVTRNVGLGQPYATISAGVAALPTTLTGHSCVAVRGGGTFSEQVTVQGFTNNGSSITILSDPASGPAPVVSPPAPSTAAFLIANASVNVMGISVGANQNIPYGVWAAPAYVQLSSVSVSPHGSLGIYTAGVRVSPRSPRSCSAVTVWGAHGFWLDVSTKTAISHSTAVNDSASQYPVYLDGGKNNGFTPILASNTHASGYALYVLNSDTNTVTQSFLWSGYRNVALDSGSDYNTISLSTMIGGSDGLYATFSESNTVTQSYLQGGNFGAYLNNGASYNTISLSTMTSINIGFWINLAVSNTVSQSFMSGGTIGAQMIGANYNAISFSTMIGSSNGLYATFADSNTVTQSYLQGGNLGAYLNNGADYNPSASAP